MIYNKKRKFFENLTLGKIKTISFLKTPAASYKNVGSQIFVRVVLVSKKRLSHEIQIKISGHIPRKRRNKNQRVFLRGINKGKIEGDDGRNVFQGREMKIISKRKKHFGGNIEIVNAFANHKCVGRIAVVQHCYRGIPIIFESLVSHQGNAKIFE